MDAYLGLFASAFAAATILPFASEAILAGLMYDTPDRIVLLWAVASLSNTLGSMVNWGLGAFCLKWKDRRWFPIKPDQLDRAQSWFNRYGVWSLLLSWVPVIGDPLTFVAGVMRVRFWLFAILVGVAKSGRYAVVALAAKGLLNL